MSTNNQVVQHLPTRFGLLPAGNVGATSHHAPAMPLTGRVNFFSLSKELRKMIYLEALVTPDPGVEALPLFYANNHFEITVKRAQKHQGLDAETKMPDVDNYAWHRFFTMWGEFSRTGSNVLQYVTRITIIYQLSMDTGFGFGADTYDKRVGFRLSSKTFDEEADEDYGDSGFETTDSEDTDSEDTDSDNESDDSEEYRELDADDVKDLEDDLVELRAELRHVIPFIPSNAPPAPDFDPVGVFELAMGEFNWPTRRETYWFLYHRVAAYETNQLWTVYPIERLTDLLWRCARDCPLAARSVDFLCDDYQHWIPGDDPYTGYDPSVFCIPHDEE